MNKKLVIVLWIFVLSSCATKIKYSANVKKNQILEYLAGYEVVTSNKKNSTAALSCTPAIVPVNERMDCKLLVFNYTRKGINFGTSNISVKIAGEKLKVIQYDQLVREIESKRSADAFVAALNNISENVNADNSGYTTTTHTGRISNQYGSANYSGTSRTYDSDKVQQAKDRANQDYRNSINIANQSASSSYKSLGRYLRMTTLIPKRRYMYDFKIEKIDRLQTSTSKVDKSPLRININIGRENHLFIIDKELFSAN